MVQKLYFNIIGFLGDSVYFHLFFLSILKHYPGKESKGSMRWWEVVKNHCGQKWRFLGQQVFPEHYPSNVLEGKTMKGSDVPGFSHELRKR